MEQIIKFAKLNAELEAEYLKTLDVLQGMFKDKEGFVKHKESIVDMLVMSLPASQREKIHSSPRNGWCVATRHSFERIVNQMIRSKNLNPEPKEEPKEELKIIDLKIVDQPEAKRQRTD